MKGAWWVDLLTVPLAVGIGLPLVYGVAFGACAPPGIGCLLPSGICATVCAGAWAQFPFVFVIGAATGIPPAGVAIAVVLALRRRPRTGVGHWTVWTLAGICGLAAASGVVIALTGQGQTVVKLALGALGVSSALLSAENAIAMWLLSGRDLSPGS